MCISLRCVEALPSFSFLLAMRSHQILPTSKQSKMAQRFALVAAALCIIALSSVFAQVDSASNGQQVGQVNNNGGDNASGRPINEVFNMMGSLAGALKPSAGGPGAQGDASMTGQSQVTQVVVTNVESTPEDAQ